MIFPTLERYRALRDLFYLIKTSEKIQVRTFQLFGMMNSFIDLVPWARLHISPIQMHLLYYWKEMEKNIYLEIPVTDHVKAHLHGWIIKKPNFFKGLPLKEKPVSQTLVLDASVTGWGAHLGQM